MQSVFWVKLVLLFLLFFGEEEFLAGVVGLGVLGEGFLGGGDLGRHGFGAEGDEAFVLPDIPDLVFLGFSLCPDFVFGFDDELAAFDHLHVSVDQFTLIFASDEVSFWANVVHWENCCVWVFEFDPVVFSEGVFDEPICELAFLDFLDHFEISLGKSHVFVIQVISNLLPPLRVFLFSKELFNLIIFFRSTYFFSLHCITHMVIIIIPVLWNIACSNQDFFI